MKTRYGLSPWISTFPESRRPAFERFRGELTTEVAIVGGGLTGCALAFTLAQSGLRPVLFEAGRLGQASAGRSMGVIGPEPGPSFRAVQQIHGLRAARTIFESWRRGALDAAALLRRANIKCDLDPSESLLVGAPGGERALEREYESREAAGVESAWLTPKRSQDRTRLDSGPGLHVRAGFVLDPYRACVGLAAAAARRRARVYERSRVSKVRAGSKDVEITVDGGVVRAATVIIATGTATAEFKPLRRHFKELERYFVLTEPIAATTRRQLFGPDIVLRDTRTPPRRFRWTRDHRLIVGGGDQPLVPERKRESARVQRTGQLMYELLTMYPAISGLHPEFGWEAPYGMTADGLPYIGPHRNYPRHLFALGGDDSVTCAFLSARLLTRRLQGQPQKGDDVLGWTR
jgi:glycine/D-amino acid oxidase-like deaminating enzyme